MASNFAAGISLNPTSSLLQLEPRVLVRNHKECRFPTPAKSTLNLTFSNREGREADTAISQQEYVAG